MIATTGSPFRHVHKSAIGFASKLSRSKIGRIARAREKRLEFRFGPMDGAVLPLLGREPIANLFWEHAVHNLGST